MMCTSGRWHSVGWADTANHLAGLEAHPRRYQQLKEEAKFDSMANKHGNLQDSLGLGACLRGCAAY